MVKPVAVALLALAASSLPALGQAETRLICENPGREYLVIYEPGVPHLLLSPDSDATSYPILVDDIADASHVVTAATVEGGPTARLHLRPYLKMEFWSDGQVIQTDGCHLAG